MYFCQVPGCDYSCESKSQINIHHIIPRSMGGSNKKNNLLEVCPNCHAKIFVDNIKAGQHAVKSDNSIIINKKVLTSAGMAIEYKYIHEEEFNYSLLRG